MNLVRIYGVGRSGSTVNGAYLAGRIRDAIHIGEAVRFDRPKVILSTYKNFIEFRIRSYPLIRYERFCREPDIYLWQNLSKMNLTLEGSRPYSQESSHGVGGNIARYGFDGTLNAESKWKEEAGLIYKWAVSLAYLPMFVWIRWGSR